MQAMLKSAQQTAERAQLRVEVSHTDSRESMRQIRARIAWRTAVLESDVANSRRRVA